MDTDEAAVNSRSFTGCCKGLQGVRQLPDRATAARPGPLRTAGPGTTAE
ncbi:hypothetical protein JGS22_017650 [Streptomyces sp. P38-E01]|uniref:Uncharacterized protein n=1 Tax=Streptomyces tardus TaxID=2780544 RepID=A0A949N9A2_9ACTN|nr:hypothetical protein [Streptomyces tardus]MBU7599391.1 hypothetical protein [Streptomyces tardus]